MTEIVLDGDRARAPWSETLLAQCRIAEPARPARRLAVLALHALLAASIIVFAFRFSFTDFSAIDHGHMLHAGWVLAQGGSHGEDYMTPCPPGIYLAVWLALELFGVRFDAPAFLSLGLGLAAAALFFELARRSRLPLLFSALLGFIAAAGIHLVWGYLWYDTLGEFLLLVVLAIAAWPGRTRAWPLAFAGLAAGLCLTVKPNIALITLAIGAFAAVAWAHAPRGAGLLWYAAGVVVGLEGALLLAGTGFLETFFGRDLASASRERLRDVLGPMYWFKFYRDLPALFGLTALPILGALLAPRLISRESRRRAAMSPDLWVTGFLIAAVFLMTLTSSGYALLHMTLSALAVLFFLRFHYAAGAAGVPAPVRGRPLGFAEGMLAAAVCVAFCSALHFTVFRAAFGDDALHRHVGPRVAIGGAFGRFRAGEPFAAPLREVEAWLRESAGDGKKVMILPNHNFLCALAGVAPPPSLLWHNWYSYNEQSIDNAVRPYRDPDLEYVLLAKQGEGLGHAGGRVWLAQHPAIEKCVDEGFEAAGELEGFLIFKRRPARTHADAGGCLEAAGRDEASLVSDNRLDTED